MRFTAATRWPELCELLPPSCKAWKGDHPHVGAFFPQPACYTRSCTKISEKRANKIWCYNQNQWWWQARKTFTAHFQITDQKSVLQSIIIISNKIRPKKWTPEVNQWKQIERSEWPNHMSVHMSVEAKSTMRLLSYLGSMRSKFNHKTVGAKLPGFGYEFSRFLKSQDLDTAGKWKVQTI